MNIYPSLQRKVFLKPCFYRYIGRSRKPLTDFSSFRSFSRVIYSSQKIIDLRKGFDDDNYWETSKKSLAQKNNGSSNSVSGLLSRFKGKDESSGLFDNPYLYNPNGLRQFSRDSLGYAHELVHKLKTDNSLEGLTKYVLRLDQLSDTLCRVIDLCEFIRSVHPDDRFIVAAQSCHEEMFEFMNVLNTDIELAQTLERVLTDSEISSRLTEEELKVGKILMDDFKKSGIYMDPETRDQFISLSQDISVIGQDFISNIDVVQDSYVTIPVRTLDAEQVNPMVLAQLSKDLTGLNYKVPCYGSVPFILLQTCKNESIRSKLWSSLHKSSQIQIKRLTQLVKLRAILARIMGKESYAAYQLEGKMAKNPHDVQRFLHKLMNSTLKTTEKELIPIAQLKCKEVGQPMPSTTAGILRLVRPWDRDYYSNELRLIKKKNNENNIQYPPINSYFTLGSVMEGLSTIFKQIYGLSFELSTIKVNETWSPEVRKITVVSETDGPVGIIYCDLFERQGKTSSPAHFTICCSREIYPQENNEDIMHIGVSNQGVKFQLPIISVVCSFIKGKEDVCLLQLNEIETLFHEMGHAMHSMLGRTKLQNISGTRCATDFVELPSILMEHFSKDERVLSQIGRHFLTGDPIPLEHIRDQLQESSYLQNCETFAQAKMSMLDQRLHDENIIDNIETLDVVELYQSLEKELHVLVDDKTNWCGKFGHLFGYGATYYSYLLDRAIASKVWDHLFKANPYSRVGGQTFKETVLQWGGLKDPWKCVADVLNKPELSKGDTAAINYIADVKRL